MESSDVGRWRSHDRTNDDEGVNRELEREVRSSSTTTRSSIATRSGQGMNTSSAAGKGECSLCDGDGHRGDSKLVECAERAAHTQSVVIVVVDKGHWEEEKNADAVRGDYENDQGITAVETDVKDNSSSTANLNPTPAPPETKSRIERRKEKKRRKKEQKKYGRDNASITNTTRTKVITTSTLPHQEPQQFNNPNLAFYPHSHASYSTHTTFSFAPQQLQQQQQQQQPFHSESPPFNYTTHQLAGGQYQHMPPHLQSNNPHSSFYPYHYASYNPHTTFSFAQQQQQQLQQQYHQPQPLYSAPLPFNYAIHQLAGGQYQHRLPPLPPPPRPPPLTSSLTPTYYHHYNNDNNVKLTIQNNNSNNHSTNIPKSIRFIVHVQPLIVLDLNGILCHRIRSRNFHTTTTTTTTTGNTNGLCYRNPCGYVAQTAIVPRTDLIEFLTLLNTHFTLAVWSSAKKKNAMVLVQMLFPPEISKQLLFVWGQNMCDIKPKMDNNNNNNEINNDVNKDVKTNSMTQSSYCDIIFIKSLCKVWKDYPLWDASNTILLDDSPDKCPDMYRNNSIHPPPIHGRCMSSPPPPPPPPPATSFSHYSACSSSPSTTSASPLSGTVATFLTDIGEGSDEHNQEKQRLFFRQLASFWSRANKGGKREQQDCNNHGEDEGKNLYSFLKQHGSGHMGWRGLC